MSAFLFVAALVRVHVSVDFQKVPITQWETQTLCVRYQNHLTHVCRGSCAV